MDDVVKYNLEFPKWIKKRPWCVTVIPGFDCEVEYTIDEDNEVHIIVIRNINFYTTQTGA